MVVVVSFFKALSYCLSAYDLNFVFVFSFFFGGVSFSLYISTCFVVVV
jgi:hypothetical protein